ncbi:uncharacterized protein LOC124120123 [Haliotis rufescens]|uniref:uncharacterized protein LOC124120123 n=1 Tax=Haliotis rufescens TaxID=6454 RepID=UPI00201ECED1|nr:uncharacterized protein LOC124120123 [Haliotis rufescens]
MASSVTDLDELLKQWAWKMYTRTKNTVSIDNAQLDVVWNKVRFQSAQANFSKQHASNVPQSQIVFSSTFDNETTQYQQHNFQTQRSTIATVTTAMSKGFTRGVNAGIKLPVPPEVLSSTAGFGNEVTIECEDEYSVQKSLSWAVNTTVNAPKEMRTVAELEILENEFKCNFKMNVSFRGTVRVNITELPSEKVLIFQNDIAQILGDSGSLLPDCVEITPKKVVWPVIGKVQFRYGVSQKVRVYQEDLEDEPVDDGNYDQYYN